MSGKKEKQKEKKQDEQDEDYFDAERWDSPYFIYGLLAFNLIN